MPNLGNSALEHVAASCGPAHFGTVPLDGRLDRIRLIPARANDQPALAAYAQNETSGEHEAYGVMVFAIDGARIAGITGFPQPELFRKFGLPAVLTD
jgi:RNA polymerase sigma-70 factor (ECF subfamily)